MQKRKMSRIVAMHYVKFIVRSLLFLSASGIYLFNRIQNTGKPFGGLEENHLVLGVIWIFFFVEMVLRFFPSKFESTGCQKQFARNFERKDSIQEPETRGQGIRTFWAAASWIMPNTVLTILYLTGVFDTGLMVLVALAYSVCDVICILFFCPFQTWILKNKCCVSCRIYNWDYAMMFTPFIFIRNFYTWSLLAMALVLLVHWEVTYRRHPERFCEETNGHLSCGKCEEKLCHHKKQLRSFLKKEKFNLKGNILFKR
ncbi:MAG: hypothetical protein E7400_07700 [Ruminococcaceae bacterium]|nr:hypothetical protein [Oscillospiraceae bacterium]